MSVLSWGAPVRSAVDCLSVSLAGSWLVDRLVDLPDGWLAGYTADYRETIDWLGD